MFAAVPNTLSDGADVAGIAKMMLASFHVFGYYSTCLLHHCNGLLY
jgi:hypothetical protein